ncbi:hypothetical protein ACIP27_31780, partial [Streptomyces hydrogenans]
MTTTHDHPGEQAADDPIKLLAIRDTPLSVDEVFRAVGDAAAGGEKPIVVGSRGLGGFSALLLGSVGLGVAA